MIIDGKTIAARILARAKARGVSPRVTAIVANETAATRSYLSIKSKYAEAAGCVFEIKKFPESVTTEELKQALQEEKGEALIVQLPLPVQVDVRAVCDAIPVSKDADVLGVSARLRFEADEPGALIPPVASALKHILNHARVNPSGKRAVVVGAGWLVGKPCATWLLRAGADVTHLIQGPIDLAATLQKADIVVSGAGSPHFIQPSMLKEGAVLFDAGTSESGGSVVGDADPACATKCALFTPVPGGVGPVAVACLFENAVTLAERSK